MAEERVHHRFGTYSDLRLGYQEAAIPLADESLIERNSILRHSSIFSSGQQKAVAEKPSISGR